MSCDVQVGRRPAVCIEVNEAYQKAVTLVSSNSVKMPIAVEQVLPRDEREARFKTFSKVHLA